MFRGPRWKLDNRLIELVWKSWMGIAKLFDSASAGQKYELEMYWLICREMLAVGSLERPTNPSFSEVCHWWKMTDQHRISPHFTAFPLLLGIFQSKNRKEKEEENNFFADFLLSSCAFSKPQSGQVWFGRRTSDLTKPMNRKPKTERRQALSKLVAKKKKKEKPLSHVRYWL